MVERCSVGYPFTVLAPQPALRTGIRVEIYDRDDPGTLVDVLPDTRNRKWVDPLFGAGAGEFEIHEDDPKLAANPTILRPGNIIRFILDEIPRFTARIERRKWSPVTSAEVAGRWITVSGRGAKSFLEDGAIYPEGGVTGNPERDLTGLTTGEAFRILKTEADARGSIVANLTLDFTDTLDSNNQPYNFTLAESAKAGRDDLLHLLERFAELGVENRVTPDLQLRLYANGFGVDKTVQTENTAPVVFRAAHNIKELELDEDLIIKNTLLVETPAGFFERAEVASQSTHGRREGYLSIGNTTDGDYIDRATNSAFAKLADIRTAITIEVLDIDGHRPYVDGDVGDWILAPNRDGDLERFRIRGLTVSEDNSGNPLFVPTLNEEDAELEDRLQRWLRTMSPGTLGGTTNEISTPNTQTVAGSEEVASDATDTHEAGFPHHDEFSDLSDVDLTGLADGQLVRYDAGIPAWVPLDIKIDITTPPTDTQVLKYDSGSDTWKPANDATGGGGGGGGLDEIAADQHALRGVPAFVREFVDAETEDSTTVEDTTPNITKSKAAGKLSVSHPGGDSSAELHGIVWPHTPAGDFYIEAAFRMLALAGNYSIVGIVAADGNTYGAGTQMFYGVNGVVGTIDIRNMSNWNNQAAGAAHNITDFTPLGLVYLRLALDTSTNVWTGYVSPDGISWLTGQTQTDANPATTHIGFAHSSWGGAIRHVAAWEYIAVYDGLP